MSSVQDALDQYADGTPYEALARAFLEFERWTGDDPVSLVAEAAASSTGQRYTGGVRSAVERFRDAFVVTERVTSFEELARLELEDEDLIDAFGAQRKRRVLLETARVLTERPEDADLAALQSWAGEADHYRYEQDPVGEISGVGPATFQYLRMLAGIDTARPDPEVAELVDALAAETGEPALHTATSLHTLAACEWLALVSDYRMVEIDRIAWWSFADEAERDEVLALDGGQ